jgi:pimeloyl-ACP methyl ester carboxylesterase
LTEETGHVIANGVRLWYARAGTGRPPLVFVPGWCCDHTTMSSLMDRLSAKHEVVGVDLRGVGQSEFGGAPFTMADLVEDLRDLCEKLHAHQPILVGHSLGGRVVLAVLQAHPDLARAGVLLDAAVEESHERVLERRAEVESDDWKRALRRRFSNLQSQAAPESASPIVERMLQTPIEAARASLRASDDFDAGRALSDCRMPILYVGASEPRESRTRLVQLNPDIIFGQVVGSAHFVQIEADAQVAAMIERFIVMTGRREATMRQ